MKRKGFFIRFGMGICLVLIPTFAPAHRTILTMKEALNRKALLCNAAQSATLTYRNQLLTYANYRKSLLPAIAFDMSPVSFNHSLRQLQDAVQGNYTYIDDYANTSSAGITVSQLIGLTGGTLSAGNRLTFLREFTRNRNSFSATLFTIGYSQPFWGGRRQFRLNDALQRKASERALRDYCTEVSDVQQKVLSLYLNAFLHKLQQEQATRSLSIEDSLLHLAAVKRKEGYLTAYDYNQIELQRLSSLYDKEQATRNYRLALQQLADYLGTDDSIAVEKPDMELPATIRTELFMERVRRNNPAALEWDMQLLEAESDWHKVRQKTGFNGTISVNYGLNQYAERFADAYRNPLNSQSVNITLQIPVFQWGINRNKRRMAYNRREAVRLEVETARREFESSLLEHIHLYEQAQATMQIARRTYALSCEQYTLLIGKFAAGRVSVYELTTARKEQNEALVTYYNNLRQLYETYFALRHLALYDFAEKKDLAEIFLH